MEISNSNSFPRAEIGKRLNYEKKHDTRDMTVTTYQ